jgi:outer membrane protein assembly factor BamB
MHRRRSLVISVIAVAGAVVSAASVAPALAATGGIDWPTISFDTPRTGANTSETTIGVGNASELHQLWSFSTDGVIDTSPVVATDVNVGGEAMQLVYVGSEHGMFYAVDSATGSLVWKSDLGSVPTLCEDLPGGVFGITSAPVIDRSTNRIFVAGGDGQVHALDLATGSPSPGWPVQVLSNPHQQHVWSGLTLLDGKLYAETASYCDFTPYHGHIAEIDVASATVGARFFPAGRHHDGGGIWGWGGASVDPANGNVYISTGNDLSAPQDFGFSEDIVRLTPTLSVVSHHGPHLIGADVDFGSAPILFQRPGCPSQLAIENKSGVLFVYDRDHLSSGPMQRLQLADVNDAEFIASPAWSAATNTMYVANSSDSSSGPYRHGMVALHEGSGCHLRLDWQTTAGPSASVVSVPVVVNGLVYYGDGIGGRVIAFDAMTGARLWSSPDFGAPIFAEPIVVNGQIYAGAWDQKLHAFGP